MINQFYNAILCSTSNQVDDIFQQLENKSTKDTYHRLEVLTIDQWVAKEYKNLEFINHEQIPKQIINSIDEKFIWEKIIIDSIKKNIHNKSITNIDELCEFCMRSNKLISEYEISDKDLKMDQSYREARIFAAWRQKFYQHIEDNHFLTRYDLIKLFTKIIDEDNFIHEQKFLVANIDPDKKNYQRLINVLAKKNQIYWINAEEKKSSPKIKRYQNIDLEINAVCDWVRNCRIKGKKNLLIVSPELSQYQQILESKINKIVQPEIYKDLSQFSKIKTKLNRPLSNEPSIKFMQNLLWLIIDEKPLSLTWQSILYYPNWLEGTDLIARQKFADVLKSTKQKKFSIKNIIFLLNLHNEKEENALINLLEFLYLMEQKKNILAKKQPIEEFNSVLIELKSKSGWFKNKNYLPFEINILESFNKVINSITSSIITDKIEAKDYFAILNYHLDNIVPQTHYHGTEITLSGFLEDHIIDYDGVWLLNMNNCFWPKKNNYNPFFSKNLLQKYCIYDDEYYEEFTYHKINQLGTGVHDFNISFSNMNNDVPMTPSLIEFLNVATFMPEKVKCSSMLSHQELISDEISLPLSRDQLMLKNGIRTLENQKKCPAWAFYENRCGALSFSIDDPDEMTKMEEGNFIHHCLERFWLRYKSHSSLLKLNDHELMHILARYVDDELNKLRDTKTNLSNDLFDCEKDYLLKVLFHWLNYEKERSPFDVLGVEERYDIEIESLKFKIRIDRIDQLSKNQNIILDYKTGANIPTRKSFFAVDIVDLQLPIYAIYAPIKNISGIGIASINRNGNKLLGVTSDEKITITKTFNGKIDSDSIKNWHDLKLQWEEIIKTTADSYLKGECAVQFNEKTDFTYCQILPLLRLPEKKYQFEKL